MFPSCQTEKYLMTRDKAGTWPSSFRSVNEASHAAVEEARLTTRIAKHPTNQQFNRYRFKNCRCFFGPAEKFAESLKTLRSSLEKKKTDVLPYDQTRVKLRSGGVEYINANHVNGDLAGFPDLDRRYILTQGPLDHTVPHFWQMMWEQNCRAIVMLNNVMENNRPKCASYWPLGSRVGDNDGFSFDGLDLELMFVSMETKDCYNLTRLQLRQKKNISNNNRFNSNNNNTQSREILHFHFTTWPDFGVPFESKDMMSLLYAVKASGALDHGAPPLVVHCSAGIGRSGSFILIDSMLFLMKARNTMEPCDMVQLLIGLRKCRMSLVQSWEQFRFCYQAVVDEAKRLFPPTTNELGVAAQSSVGISGTKIAREVASSEKDAKKNAARIADKSSNEATPSLTRVTRKITLDSARAAPSSPNAGASAATSSGTASAKSEQRKLLRQAQYLKPGNEKA